MSLSEQEIRLRVIEALMPGLTRLGVNDPEVVNKKADVLANYVINGYPSTSEDSTSESKPVVKKVTRRRKQSSPKHQEDNDGSVLT